MSVPAEDEVVALCEAGRSDALAGRLENAMHHYERALALAPDFRAALYNRATLLLQLRRPADSLECADRILALGPAPAVAHLARANALMALERPADALASFEEAIRLDWSLALAHANRGNTLLALGRPREALASLDRALALAPGDALALYNRGNVLLALSRPADAVAAFEQAVRSDPHLAPAWYNLGTTLMDLQRLAEAVASFDRVLELAPAMAAAHNNRAAALRLLGRPADAQVGLERALALRPDHAGALENLGNAQFELRRFEEAAGTFRKLLATVPDWPYAPGTLLAALGRCCDWSDEYFSLRERVVDSVARGLPAQMPFPLLGICDEPAVQLGGARTCAADKFPPAPEPLWRGRPYAHRRIQVAYVSADFHQHATAFLAAELFERHDREKFEWTAVSFGPDDGGPMRRRLERAFDHFLDVRDLSDHDIARRLAEREIDIAVDLKGYTTGCRLGIFAHRPAPVQVNYLGYPGTVGAPYIDYIVADEQVIPREHFPCYSEKVVHLPRCYQPNGSGRPPAGAAPGRAELSLPEGAFVFCCFNASYKITPEMFDLWMRLLRAVPGSVLWLLDDHPATTANLRAQGARRGIDRSRLVFAPRAPLPEHLARCRAADLFLDTLPCNAHTTASDALWAGLPVLTCRGGTFAGRVASSLLHAVGAPELIASDPGEYERLALALATDRGRHAAVRARLADCGGGSPLFDAGRHRLGLEAAYILMWQRAENRLPPIHFAVPDRSIGRVSYARYV